MESFEILCGIAIVILAIYYYLTSTYNFWKSRNVAGPTPALIFGNAKDFLLMKKHMCNFLMEIYNYKNEPMVGIFVRKTPVLILRDPELIKDVLIKDFSKFTHREFSGYEKAEPLSQHLILLEPKKWRPMRTRLSPVFTSGKLKEMFPLIVECSEHLEKYLEKLVSKNKPIECRELTAKFTTDVIGSCAFGIDMNSLSDKDSEFRKMGKAIFDPTWTNILRAIMKQSFPRLYNILGYILPRSEIGKFFTRIIRENIDYREKNNIIRHDFVDTLRELKKQPEKFEFELTDSLITAQAFVFFAAGFETSSTTMSNALYELALNHKIQDKLREEINQEYAKNGANLSYDDIKKMDYLDKVFKETLRKYPASTFLRRESTSSYTFENTKVSIPKNQTIWIPIYAIQRDPSIYPEPDVFDPERFSEDVMRRRHSMFYLPFGDGPRNCIGARFATLQTKIGLIKILRNYKVDICEQTITSYVNDPKTFLLAPKGGIILKITKIIQS